MSLSSTENFNTILIVDDNPSNLRLLSSVLSDQGYDVRLAPTGSLALMSVQQNLPDLILLDVLMPKMDGYEVCEKLKSDPKTEEIPVIFMTALTDTMDKVKAFDLGAVDYITKPFQQEEVLARVRLHIQLRQVTKTLDKRNKQLEELTEQLEQRVIERTASLRESEECLRQLTENISSIFWLTNQERTKTLYVSSAYEQIWGYQKSTLFSSPDSWLDAVHQDDKPEVIETLKEGKRDGCELEYRIIQPNGSIRWVRDRCFQICNPAGQIYRIARITEDITDKRNTEEIMRLQQRAIDASSNGIIIFDALEPNFPISYVNPAFLTITGYKDLEISGQNYLSLFRTSNNLSELTTLRTALEQKKSCTIEFRSQRKDGSFFWSDLRIAPIDNIGDELTHFIGIQTDISERKEAELSLHQSLREKELLLKEIHHRVKNNLLVVSSLLGLQADRVHDLEIVRLFEESQNRISSMALIHEMLYRSKNLARIDLSEYLKSLTIELSSTLDSRNQEIDVEFISEKIFMNIETTTPCGLIINELVSNCFKHAFLNRESGKIRLEVKRVKEKLVSISVCDDGIGMPDDIDLYNTESLGLQIVTLLTRQLNGEIEVFRNQGTCFKLTFSELKYQERI